MECIILILSSLIKNSRCITSILNMSEKLTQDIVKTSKILRQKYRALKMNRAEGERVLKESLDPITKPLNEISAKIILKSKEHPEIAPKPSFGRIIKKKKKVKIINIKKSDDIISNDDYITEDEYDTPTNSPVVRKFINDSNFDAISKQYFSDYLDNSKVVFDTKYGVYQDPITNDWRIGDSKFKIDNGYIFIKENKYLGTRGLYELLFKKNPIEYNESDLTSYGEILKDTNAYKINFASNGRVNSDRSAKYRNIIKDIISKKHHGFGLLKVTKPNTDYVYWNDPNELTDRLKLLIASQQAGHNNHNNEIISIIEELREANIII